MVLLTCGDNSIFGNDRGKLCFVPTTRASEIPRLAKIAPEAAAEFADAIVLNPSHNVDKMYARSRLRTLARGEVAADVPRIRAFLHVNNRSYADSAMSRETSTCCFGAGVRIFPPEGGQRYFTGPTAAALSVPGLSVFEFTQP
ncbi:MAG: hypothetical protein Q8O67_25755 [Deltaproteobacteria bacterium]|nr:hypothetical protein [Deltaproteobacteria bacterium]